MPAVRVVVEPLRTDHLGVRQPAPMRLQIPGTAASVIPPSCEKHVPMRGDRACGRPTLQRLEQHVPRGDLRVELRPHWRAGRGQGDESEVGSGESRGRPAFESRSASLR